MSAGYLRWGSGSNSSARVRKMIEKARQFKKGEEVLAGGQKGKVTEITEFGSIMVRIGGGAPRKFHPDQVQKLNT